MATKLNTNYKDDIINTNVNPHRRYRLTEVSGQENVYEFEETTSFIQVGTDYGATDVNTANGTINDLIDEVDDNATTLSGILAGTTAIGKARTADTATSATNATRATTAGSATSALSATRADTAGTATRASRVASATNATRAGRADTASNALHATTADTAGSATTAGTATRATNADSATSANTATRATTADSATTATTATTANKLKTARTINGVAFDGTQDITVYDNTKISTDQDFILRNQQSLTFTNKVCRINDSRITVNSLADVYFTSATIESAKKANVTVDTFNGYMTLTVAQNPTMTLVATIQIRVI